MVDLKNVRVIFTDKAEDVFSEIIKKYELQETDEEFFNDIEDREESRRSIVKDAITVMVKRIIPEEKLVEFLEKHLNLPKESTQKMVADLKNNLLPILLVYPEEKFNDSFFREEVSKKVFKEVQEITPPTEIIKKIGIKDVEENAERLERGGKRGPDEYREVIE